MINKIIKFLLITLILSVGLGAAASALTPVIPADSALNPVNEVLYVVDNSVPRIKVYTRSVVLGWSEVPSENEALPSGSKCYGLEVNPAGTKLYASINKGASSAIRVYTLDGTGFPTSHTDITGIYFTYAPDSSPAGMALGSNNRLFVADLAKSRVLVFNTVNNTFVKAITGELKTEGANPYDVAAVPMGGGIDKLYISHKFDPGAVYVYEYNNAVDAATFIKKINSGLADPTYLKVAGNKLYVAVNGTGGDDIQVYSTADESLIGTVRSGVTGSYGWTSLAISGDYLYFKKAKNSSETSNGLYRQRISDISGTVTATELTDVIGSDGLKISSNGGWVALSNSPNGSVERINLTEILNPPAIVADFEASDGENSQSTLTWTNPSDSDLAQVIVVRTANAAIYPDDFPKIDASGAPTQGSIIYDVTSPAPGSAVVHVDTGLTNGTQYAYAVYSRDADGNWNTTLDLLRNADFGAPLAGMNTPPNAFNLLAPPNGGEACCDVPLRWENNGDPDGDALTYHVVVYPQGDSTPVIDDTTSSNTYAIPLGTLTVGEVYEWNVQADDGRGGRVWANGDEMNRWTFTYIEGIVVAGDPFITLTSPVNGYCCASSTDPIVITFNESILSTSLVVDIVPAVTGISYSWNSTQTVLTINHDPLTPTVGYTVTVNATDLGGAPLTTGPVPNPFSFTVANEMPNAFNLLAPPDDGEACCDVPLRWENNGDPDGDTLSYRVVVYPQGNPTAVIDDTASTNTFNIPLGTLTVGNVYEWNVRADDGHGAEVWANGGETNRWTFTYIDGIEVPGDPFITSTTPTNNATDVSTTDPLVVTFNESILSSSLVVDIVPAVTGVSYSWNSTQTVLTINHDALAASTSYTVTVNGTDLGGAPLTAGPVPNPFSFTTGTGAGVTISNVNIVRDGDSVGDSVTVTWDTTPPSSAVDVYALTGSFTTDPASWTIASPGVTIGTYTDLTQVGQGTQKYYKIVPAGATLTSLDLTSDVVGKFDLTINEGSNLVSLPFVPASTDPNDVIGEQLTGGTPITADKIYHYDAAATGWIQAYLSPGPGGTWNGALAAVEADKGYFIARQAGNGNCEVTVVGKLYVEGTRNIDLYTGSNMIGSIYPISIALDDTGLDSVLTSGTPINADKVYYYDNNTVSPGWVQAYLSGAGFAGGLTALEPGKGYYVTNQELISEPTPDNWNYTNP